MLGSGEAGARGLQALAFLLLTRRLGKNAFGQFSFALAVTNYLLLFVQQGFDPIAIRWVAQGERQLLAVVERILGLRLALASALALGMAGYALLGSSRDPLHGLLLVLCGLYFSTALNLRWPFLAQERMAQPAHAVFWAQAVFLGSVLLVRSPAQLVWAGAAQALGEMAGVVFLWRSFSDTFPAVRPRWDAGFVRSLLAISWPISVAGLLGTMIYNFDVVVLRGFGRDTEIGAYVAVYRCITVFSPLLVVLQSAIYPGFAQAWPDFSRLRGRVLHLSLLATAGFGVVAVLLFAFARPLIVLLFGQEYASGAGYLQVLAWVLPVQGCRAIFRQIIYAWRWQHADLRNLALAAATNVVLDFLWIPSHGAMGCAWSTLCAETIFFVGCLISAAPAWRKSGLS